VRIFFWRRKVAPGYPWTTNLIRRAGM